MRRRLLILGACTACGRIGYEPMAIEAAAAADGGRAAELDAAPGTSSPPDAERPAAAVPDADARADGPGEAAAWPPGSEAGRPPAARDGGSSAGPGAPAVPAAPCGTTERAWTFSSSPDGWEYGIGGDTMAVLSWSQAAGGTLKLDVLSGTTTNLGGWVRLLAPAAVAGKTIVGAVWIDADAAAGVTVKPYAQSYSGGVYAWADGGRFTVPARAWTCVQVNTASPVFAYPEFAADKILYFGFEVWGSHQFMVYFDQIGYR